MKKKVILHGGIWFCVLFVTLFVLSVTSLAQSKLSGIGLLADEDTIGNAHIYQVTLPTDDSLKVVLDPQGLTSLKNGHDYDKKQAGKILMEKNGGALFINQSSFPVKIEVGLSVAQNAKGASSTIQLMETKKGVNQDEWPRMYLTAIPGTKKIRKMSKFVPSNYEIPILANGKRELTKFSFLLNSSEYIYDQNTDTYSLLEKEDNYDSASFILGGKVNKYADWSGFVGKHAESLVIHAVYTIREQSYFDTSLLVGEEEGMPHGLLQEE